MGFLQRIVEAPPAVRWYLGVAKTNLLYRRTFASIGARTVIVSPEILRGVDRISVGADCSIRESAWLQCEDGGSISIGDGTVIAHRVHIHSGDPVRVGRGCRMGDGVMINSADHTRHDRSLTRSTGPITIGDNVFLGAGSVVLGGVTIGDDVTVGTGAVVTRDVAPGLVVGGVPARVISTAHG